MLVGQLPGEQGVDDMFQNSFIFMITSVTRSHLSLPARQLPNYFSNSCSLRWEAPNTQYKEGQEEPSLVHLHFRGSQDLGSERRSIAMPPLSPAHLIVPLAQLAPSHLSEKKNNWMLVRNDQIKI